MKTQDTNFNPKMSSEGQELSDNELIAEFMGYRKIEGSHLYRDPDSTVYVSDARDFAYHYRWDWLMPVVYKIDSLDLPNIEISIGKFKGNYISVGTSWKGVSLE